jgi:predicted DNA-binding protein (MmcQ/YjbR family)
LCSLFVLYHADAIGKWSSGGLPIPSKSAERLRAICLALPGAAEKPMRRGPTYRVNDRIFAMERPHDGAVAVWCKAPAGSQAVLIGADPDRFFVPPYVGPKGWIGIRLDKRPDWNEVAALIERSYRLIAPKRRRP